MAATTRGRKELVAASLYIKFGKSRGLLGDSEGLKAE